MTDSGDWDLTGIDPEKMRALIEQMRAAHHAIASFATEFSAALSAQGIGVRDVHQTAAWTSDQISMLTTRLKKIEDAAHTAPFDPGAHTTPNEPGHQAHTEPIQPAQPPHTEPMQPGGHAHTEPMQPGRPHTEPMQPEQGSGSGAPGPGTGSHTGGAGAAPGGSGAGSAAGAGAAAGAGTGGGAAQHPGAVHGTGPAQHQPAQSGPAQHAAADAGRVSHAAQHGESLPERVWDDIERNVTNPEYAGAYLAAIGAAGLSALTASVVRTRRRDRKEAERRQAAIETLWRNAGQSAVPPGLGGSGVQLSPPGALAPSNARAAQPDGGQEPSRGPEGDRPEPTLESPVLAAGSPDPTANGLELVPSGVEPTANPEPAAGSPEPTGGSLELVPDGPKSTGGRLELVPDGPELAADGQPAQEDAGQFIPEDDQPTLVNMPGAPLLRLVPAGAGAADPVDESGTGPAERS
ncbi:MAG TPA: hypothetical protein VFE59_11715 [Trebonia sp.]|jgi:hypothetical protein|nr:hypothetical protein [Trebonia sp.]